MQLKAAKGFSMIEILVALVILAVGLLGMATLMINSLQTSQSAAWRSAATLAAYDLAERMRSNQGALIDDTAADSTPPSYARPLQEANVIGKNNDQDAKCSGSPEEVAQCDLEVWANALNQSIPGSWVVITKTAVDDTKNNLYCVGIFWEDSGGKDVSKESDNACGQSAKIKDKLWSFYEVKVLI